MSRLRYAICDYFGHRWHWAAARPMWPGGRTREGECRNCGSVRYARSLAHARHFRGRTFYLLGAPMRCVHS